MESHQKALAAIAAGRFNDEIVPVPVRAGKEEVAVRHRRRARAPTRRIGGAGPTQASLRPARSERRSRRRLTEGTVTAGNAPGITDGAAATVVASERAVERYGLKPLARIVGYAPGRGRAQVALPRAGQGRRGSCSSQDRACPSRRFDLIEINEAFAAQVLADGRELGFDWSKVNVNGGAIALGHPIGASGARIVATLLHELRRREGRYGLATLCLGGGGSVAMAFERV